MARTRGCEGTVKIGATPDVVGEVTSYSFESSAEILDGSSIGTCTKISTVGQIETTGTFDFFWDENDAGQAVIVVGDTVTLEFFPEGDVAGDTYFTTNDALITALSIAGSVGTHVTRTASFTVNGMFTESTVV